MGKPQKRRWTPIELHRIVKEMVNKVLILPDKEFNSINGFLISDPYNPVHHLAVTGTVMEVCDSLKCDFERFKELLPLMDSDVANREMQMIRRYSLNFMPHSIEVKVGDKVLVRNRSFYEKDMDIAHYIGYDQILCKITDTIEPINGFIFVNPDIESSSIQDYVYDEKESVQLGTIVYQSTNLNKGYLHPTATDYPTEVNTKIRFMNHMYSPSNHRLHPIFKDFEQLYVMNRWVVLGVVN